MLTNQYNFSPDAKTVTQVVANLGALAGGKNNSHNLRSLNLLTADHISGTTIGYCMQITYPIRER